MEIIMTAIATYVGGPLNGQAVRRTGTRWPLYRADDGAPLSARQGDAEWCGRRRRGQGDARRYYIRQSRNGEELYVHASVWTDFDRRRMQ